MPNEDYRAEQSERREHGLKARHEQRLAHALEREYPGTILLLVATDLLADLGDWSQPVQVMIHETPGAGTGYELIFRTPPEASA